MSEWITDRPPTDEDADYEKCVWTMCVGKVVTWEYGGIREGQPWMRTNRPKPYVKPIPKCEPYVKPKRYRVKEIFQASGRFAVYDFEDGLTCSPSLPTIEAAERIVAIYEEVMP